MSVSLCKSTSHPRDGWEHLCLPWWPRLVWSPALILPAGNLWLKNWRRLGLASLLMNWLSFQHCFPFLFWVFIGHVWRQRPSLIPLCPPPSLQPQGEKRGGGKRCRGRKHLCPIKCNCHKDNRHPAPANSQLTPWHPKYLLSYSPWVFYYSFLQSYACWTFSVNCPAVCLW